MEAYEAFATVVQQAGFPLTITAEKRTLDTYNLDFTCSQCGIRLYRNTYTVAAKKGDIDHWLTYNGADLVSICLRHTCIGRADARLIGRWTAAVDILVRNLRR